MGIMNHNAVIATTWNQEEVERIRKFVTKTAPDSFLFGDPQMNNETTVVLIPDGSKEGWDVSDQGDVLRGLFIKELEKANYSDGSSPWDWVEVGYGEYGQKILRGNCSNRYGDEEYAG